MKLIAEGTVVASKPPEGQSCAFPGVCVLPSGRWLCGFRTAPTKSATRGQRVWLTHSDDGGRTWSAPRPVADPPPVGGRPGLFRAAFPTPLGGRNVAVTLMWVDHSQPDLPFFNETTEGLLDCRIFHARSADEGLTWSPPRLMDTTPFNQPTPITGPLIIRPNGEWIAQFELNKAYDEPAPWHHKSVLMFSRDGGQSWPEYSIVTHDPTRRVFYWDQRPGLLADGSLLDLFWTYDNQAATYLNIHARRSADGGRTWSALWDTGVPGQPAPPVELADGRIAMVYVDRTAAPTIKCRTSGDGGRSWPAETEVVVAQPLAASQTEKKGCMQDAWSEMAKFSLGLPHTARTADGGILVVYYRGPETDRTDIKWALLR